MEKTCVCLLLFCLILVAVDCSLTDLKAEVSSKTGSDSSSDSGSNLEEKTRGSESVLSTDALNRVKKNGGKLVLLATGLENDANKTEIVKKSRLEEEQKGKQDSDVKDDVKLDDRVGQNDVNEKKSNKPARTENPRIEECDPANMCRDEEDKFVACLRVPGNESPHLSLLIQNKGNGLVTIKLSASGSIRLEISEVQLQKNEDQTVKVSIEDGAINASIHLKSAKGHCSLDVRGLVANSLEKESNNPFKSSYLDLLPRGPILFFLFITVILVSVSICIVFYRRRQLKSNVYQRLDMELPVSNQTKTEEDTNGDWNNSWSDGWEDEEAPKTLSMPVTPSLSAKGLASRRMNKDGWKD